ncbi:MAG: phosphoglucomutase/phosphomannomutase family protein [Bacteroidetes bacterium]|nr:phosphoglucomutase/phosphomannomutase family protein [Bacteroidota bacterium]
MTYPIKFGTDGWRDIIALNYTVENVKRVAEATALWILNNKAAPKVAIGFDCRFGGLMFMKSTAEIMCKHGIECLVSEVPITTPMVSMCTHINGCSLGIVITASHNPPDYNGFKLKATYGGPASPNVIAEVESLIPDTTASGHSYEELLSTGNIRVVDMESIYADAVEKAFDMKLLRSGELQFAYDAMYGAGQDVMRRLFPDITFLHCEHNPGFDGQAPEPIHKNLLEFSELIELAEDIDSGLATDGDADRIGLYNNSGEFIDSHHIILLLIHYLHKVQGMGGKVVKSFSCSSRIDKLCAHYGLEAQTTKIGFKYICDIMVNDDVLIGAEESGGIAIKGHIPERDGIWIGLVIWEFMAKSGKSLNELIEDIYAITGSFAVERYDLHISAAQKDEIVEKCHNNFYTQFGSFKVGKVEDLDGFKYHLGDDRWVMIRPSGTEPVLRVYAEAESSEAAFNILNVTKETILGS